MYTHTLRTRWSGDCVLTEVRTRERIYLPAGKAGEIAFVRRPSPTHTDTVSSYRQSIVAEGNAVKDQAASNGGGSVEGFV